jgi:hypothetical protein
LDCWSAADLRIDGRSLAAHAWGQEGHSITAEIAQQRVSPAVSVEVARLLGTGRFLPSFASWGDDERDWRPETYRCTSSTFLSLNPTTMPVRTANLGRTATAKIVKYC